MGILPPMNQENNLFSQCKNRQRRNLKIYFVYSFSTSGFALPLPCDFGKGLPTLHSEQIWENRPREFEIIKKSNLANDKSPIQDWQFGKTSIAYTMPILYNRAILALI